MSNLIKALPEVSGDEALYLNKLTAGMSHDQLANFANAYRARRKDPQIILITCLIGLISIAGIHRMLLGQIGMGVLYLFTAGLCFIGTIVDLVNYKDLTFRYNREIALEVKQLV